MCYKVSSIFMNISTFVPQHCVCNIVCPNIVSCLHIPVSCGWTYFLDTMSIHTLITLVCRFQCFIQISGFKTHLETERKKHPLHNNMESHPPRPAIQPYNQTLQPLPLGEVPYLNIKQRGYPKLKI